MWQFFSRWPTAKDAAQANAEEIRQLIKDLGLGDRRSKTLVRMSQDYLTWDRADPKELHGIGEYAAAAYKIFCEHAWAKIPEPKDGALKNYWRWVNSQQN